MPETKDLRNKTVILKMAGPYRAVSTNVVHEEENGLWFSGGGLLGELTEAGIPEGVRSPVVFVPFPQIHYLIAENM
jgi:hypothetical protein